MARRPASPEHSERSVERMLSRRAPVLSFGCPSAFCQERARVGNLGPAVIRSIGDRDDLAVILLSLGGLTGLFGGLRRAHIGAEAVWLLLYRRFKGGKRVLCIAALEQHDTVEFARRPWHRATCRAARRAWRCRPWRLQDCPSGLRLALAQNE